MLFRSVCNEILKAQEEVAAKGHKEETIPAVEGSCAGQGLTEGKKCTVCGTVTVEQKPTTGGSHNKVIYYLCPSLSWLGPP